MNGIYPKSAAASAVALLSYLFGAYDALMMALVSIMCIETIAAIIRAIREGKLCSSRLFDLGAKKIGILSIIALANVVDGILELAGILRSVTISYFIASEGISLLEDWGFMGLPVPKKIKHILLQLRSEKEELDENK